MIICEESVVCIITRPRLKYKILDVTTIFLEGKGYFKRGKKTHPHLVQSLLYLNRELFRELLGFFAIFFTKFPFAINEKV